MEQQSVVEAEEVEYPSTTYAWYCVFVLLGIYLNSFLDRQILGLIVDPMKETMDLSDSEVGFLMGPAFAIFYTVAGLPLGWLADRMTRRWLIAIGQAFWSMASIAFGLSRSYGQMVGARVGVGIGEASLSPSAYSLITDMFPPHRLARALSVYAMGIYLGGGLANLIGAQLTGVFPPTELHALPIVGERFGWQVIFFMISLPTIPLTLLLLTLREPQRRGMGLVRDAAGTLRPKKVPISEFFAYAWTNKRTFLTHGLGFSLLSFSGYGASAWLPAFFMRMHGWSPREAGTYLGLAALMGLPGLWLGGWLGDYFASRGRRDSKMLAGVVAALSWLPTGIAMPLMPDGTLAYVLLLPTLMLSAMPWGIAPAAIQEIVPNQMRGQASAVYLFLINLVGLGLGPQVLAWVTDYIFADEKQIHLSLVFTTTVAHVGSGVLLLFGLPAFRRSREYRDRWLGQHS